MSNYTQDPDESTGSSSNDSQDVEVITESVPAQVPTARADAAIPIINPVDRSVVVTPRPPTTSTDTPIDNTQTSPTVFYHAHPSPQPSPQRQQPSEPAAQTTSTFKSPNVYINGLPPYLSESELYALAAPFGPVRSVRSFTRHVGSTDSTGHGVARPSGYGFVLFEAIESAEKCIEALKKYRNLHPSFSKQLHKIPGTPYTAIACTSSEDNIDPVSSGNSTTSNTTSGGVCTSTGLPEDSFKTRMERLSDHTSTNVYMEGLPLSIDEPTLAALVSPYAIKSSRFFQTKLSHPPRIIAFVRLETRQAATEIIERLHGRMVRGWNDSGSRISVRFADTSEQRELRRAERVARATAISSSSSGFPNSRLDDHPQYHFNSNPNYNYDYDDEHMGSRLTIAQAALLNLRGQELRRGPLGRMPSSSSLPTIASLSSSSGLPTLGSGSTSSMSTLVGSPCVSMQRLPGHKGHRRYNEDHEVVPNATYQYQRNHSRHFQNHSSWNQQQYSATGDPHSRAVIDLRLQQRERGQAQVDYDSQRLPYGIQQVLDLQQIPYDVPQQADVLDLTAIKDDRQQLEHQQLLVGRYPTIGNLNAYTSGLGVGGMTYAAGLDVGMGPRMSDMRVGTGGLSTGDGGKKGTYIPEHATVQVQARNGYTPAEEMILQAHCAAAAGRERQVELGQRYDFEDYASDVPYRRNLMQVQASSQGPATARNSSGMLKGSSGVGISIGVRGQRTAGTAKVVAVGKRGRNVLVTSDGAEARLEQGSAPSGYADSPALPPSHSQPTQTLAQQPTQAQQLQTQNMQTLAPASSYAFTPPQVHSPLLSGALQRQAHMRSTTLPLRGSGSGDIGVGSRQRGHQQHSSISTSRPSLVSFLSALEGGPGADVRSHSDVSSSGSSNTKGHHNHSNHSNIVSSSSSNIRGSFSSVSSSNSTHSKVPSTTESTSMTSNVSQVFDSSNTSNLRSTLHSHSHTVTTGTSISIPNVDASTNNIGTFPTTSISSNNSNSNSNSNSSISTSTNSIISNNNGIINTNNNRNINFINHGSPLRDSSGKTTTGDMCEIHGTIAIDSSSNRTGTIDSQATSYSVPSSNLLSDGQSMRAYDNLGIGMEVGGGGESGMEPRANREHRRSEAMSHVEQESEQDGLSASLISPALTYSSQHTPSTLSPATPYFGSFGCVGQFKDGVMGNHVPGEGHEHENGKIGIRSEHVQEQARERGEGIDTGAGERSG